MVFQLSMSPVLFGLIGDIGGPELILVFVLVLLLFGGQRLPDFARGLGKSIREFKKATSGVEEEIKRAMEEPRPAPKYVPTPPPPELPEHHNDMGSEYLPPEALPPADPTIPADAAPSSTPDPISPEGQIAPPPDTPEGGKPPQS
jgi:TatA/E family protein of Tat protein translocase